MNWIYIDNPSSDYLRRQTAYGVSEIVYKASLNDCFSLGSHLGDLKFQISESEARRRYPHAFRNTGDTVYTSLSEPVKTTKPNKTLLLCQ